MLDFLFCLVVLSIVGSGIFAVIDLPRTSRPQLAFNAFIVFTLVFCGIVAAVSV